MYETGTVQACGSFTVISGELFYFAAAVMNHPAELSGWTITILYSAKNGSAHISGAGDGELRMCLKRNKILILYLYLINGG